MKAIKDSFIYLGGELTAKIIPFLLLPYLSRKLGVEGFGELSYYQTFLTLFVIVVSLSQEGAIARYFYFYGKRALNLMIKAGYSYTLFIGSIILIICWLLKSEILAYVAISAIFQSFLNVQLSVRQCQKQAISYAAIQLFLTITSAIFTVLMLEITENDLVAQRFLAILFSNLLVFSLSYFIYSKNVKNKKNSIKQYKNALLYIIGFGLPLLLHHISIFLKGQLDRIFIYHKFSETELGLYAMGAQIALILAVAIQAINKATLPHFYEALKKEKINITHIQKWASYSLLLTPIPSLIVWLIPESLITWGLGEAFLGTKYYILLFLFSTTLVIPYLILVNYLFYYGKNKFISMCSVLSTIIYLISLISLTFTQIEYIPFAGIIGSLSIIPILYFMTHRVSKTI